MSVVNTANLPVYLEQGLGTDVLSAVLWCFQRGG